MKITEVTICDRCTTPVNNNYLSLHRQNCTREDNADIGTVDPDDLQSRSGGLAEVTKTFHCDSCDREVLTKYRGNHFHECTPEDPLDEGLANPDEVEN